MNILFMGTPDIAAAALEAILDAGHTVCGVYTRADKPVGRKQVLTAANANRLGGAKTVKVLPMKKAPKVGPNDPCPCGSGKKYKKCCGAVTRQ